MNRLGFTAGNVVTALLLVITASAQQRPRSYTWVEEDGSNSRLGTDTGYTNTVKGVSKTIYAPEKLTKDCVAAERYGETELAPLCDRWAELHPATQIEQLPFSKFVYRLVEFSSPYTDFARYRGMELKSDKTGVQYDALLVPSDLGSNVVCTVVDGRQDAGSMAVFRCILKTMAYPSAIATQKALVSQLKNLNLVEDQAREHGIAVSDKDEYRCAVTGECEHTYMYLSASNDGKRLAIVASPDFIHNLREDMINLAQFGHGLPPIGISTNAGFVTIEVWSSKDSQTKADSQQRPKAAPTK